MPRFVELWIYLSASPLFGLTATLVVYLLAQAASARLGGAPWANPVLWSVLVLASGLLATGVDYPSYFAGVQAPKVWAMVDTLRQRRRVWACYAGAEDAVIHANGDVAICEQVRPFGNLAEFGGSLATAWTSEAAETHRRQLTSCACTHGCNINTSISLKRTPENLARNVALVRELEDVGARNKASAAQVALAWLLARGEHVVPIPGTNHVHNLEQNAAAVELELPPSAGIVPTDLESPSQEFR